MIALRHLAALPATALAGCATTAPVVPAMPVAEVTYETTPCYGTCPVYAVTVSNRGEPGTFEGRQHTAVIGSRPVPIQPAQFNAFYLALVDARAADQRAYEPGGANCQLQVIDMPGVTVTFREGTAAPRVFRYSFGCGDRQNAKLAADLRRAPMLLPIAGLIGRR